MIQLPEMPKSVAKLPRDDRGYPVPWFVQWIDGKPEFRVMDGNKWNAAIKQRLCWVCGEQLAANQTFVIGPMCAINRVTSEPPCHPECAIFSAKACPFLTLPKAQRREANMPEGGTCAGIGLKRNPGVACLWYSRTFEPFNAGNGILLRIGNPSKVQWFCEGRKATRDEIMESINGGLPILQSYADDEGPKAQKAFAEAVKSGLKWVPNV